MVSGAAGKQRSALLRGGQLLLPSSFYKGGGLPNGYIFRFDSDRYFNCWYHQSVHTDKKEVIAGTLAKYGDHIT